MRKKLTAILAMLLAVLLLCGSALPDALDEADDADVIPHFNDMSYVRPDPAAFRVISEKLNRALNADAGYRRIVTLLGEMLSQYYTADTMSTYADIRNCLDLTDEYWAEEYAQCLSALTEIGDLMEDSYLACGASPYGDRLEREFFGEGFLAEYGENAVEKLSPSYVKLMEEENELLAEYRRLTAQPVIELNGEEVPLSDAIYNVSSEEEFETLYNAYYEKYNPLLGELYIRLMRIWKEQAKQLGYDSYAEMMYDIGFDRDFSVEEGRAFMESVRKWVLPVYRLRMDDELQAELAEGYVSEEQLYGVLEALARDFGGEIRQAYDFMRRYELCDLSAGDTKANISFQTYLDDYEAPFLFVNPNGDREDLITVTHEFGHYAEAYISYGRYRSMDLAEVFSQSMQFLSLKPLTDVLGKDETDVLWLMNLYDVLDTFIWQTAYASFEDRAFRMEEPSVEKLNALMREICREYCLANDDDMGAEMGWVTITHFFETPFYVISYPISACCALEIFEREMLDGSGLDTYLRLVESEEIGLIGAAEEAGLQNPLTDERVRKTAEFLDAQFSS